MFSPLKSVLGSRFSALGLLLLPGIAGAQSNVVVSPFASYVPSAATNPLVGMSLTFGGTTGLALRGGAMLAISNADSLARMQGYNRPWSADADMMFYMGGIGAPRAIVTLHAREAVGV